MKTALSFVFAICFVIGIVMICFADTGMFGNFLSATIAGALVSIFSGVCLSISVYSYYRNKK